MKLLAISEHYFPRVGGTVNYLHETLSALVRQGVDVELFVPGPAPNVWLPNGVTEPGYEVVWVDAGYPVAGDPSRAARYTFCREVNRLALARARGRNAPDMLHVVFGLFVMEILNTDALRAAGLRSVATVHNVPPQECRLAVPESSFGMRFCEDMRLLMVGWKNRARLRAHRYDDVIVPSDQVRSLLKSVLPRQEIGVIGHGPTGELMARIEAPATRRPRTGKVRLLTAGGFAPHKRQHLIPEIASLLRDIDLDFVWDVIGPSGRIAGYYDRICNAVSNAGLQNRVRIRAAAPIAELAELYDSANIYVQPSVEEGFCITALDAAASGLPVIASPAGALEKIAEASGGAIVKSAVEPLAKAIAEFALNDRWGDAAAQANAVRAAFSWDAAGQALRVRYAKLAGHKQASLG